LAAILNEPSPPVPRSLPPALRDAIAGCLEKDPARRTSRAADVAAALSGGSAGPQAAVAPTMRFGRAASRGIWVEGIIAAVVVVLAGVVVFTRIGCGPHRVDAIAVLPLANYSRDPEQQYFADGMTDELTATLGQLNAVRVIAYNSVADYSPARRSIRDEARELGVQAVVTGSVYRSSGMVRIVIQLVEGRSGRLLWAHSYERAMRDVLTLQNELCTDIAAQIKAELTPVERTRLATPRPVDPNGFDSYLRARAAWAKYTKEGFIEAQQLYQQAIDRDPRDARAWAGLAQAIYGASSIFVAPNEAMPRSRAAAEKALAIDSLRADGYTSRGIAKMVYDWDWPESERDFRHALALQPNSADAHWWLGHLLVSRRRFDAGIAELKQAQTLDPLSSWALSSLGWHLLYAGRPGEANSPSGTARRSYVKLRQHYGLARYAAWHVACETKQSQAAPRCSKFAARSHSW
jgi:TolB-like protein/Tfp pilus assembly protein PilF